MLGLSVFKRMVGHVAINRYIFVSRLLAKGEAWTTLLLHPCRKDVSSKHYVSSLRIAPFESLAPSRRMGGRGR